MYFWWTAPPLIQERGKQQIDKFWFWKILLTENCEEECNKEIEVFLYFF